MVKIENELFILNGEELEYIKKKSLVLLNDLPEEPMTALLIVTYLKKTMEGALGKEIKGIKIMEPKK